MLYKGFILHHSACSRINGRGYDFLVLEDGGIIPGSESVEPGYLHICLEGDFDRGPAPAIGASEQIFVLNRLLRRLCPDLDAHRELLLPHGEQGCPGMHFPWDQLVISAEDGYH